MENKKISKTGLSKTGLSKKSFFTSLIFISLMFVSNLNSMLDIKALTGQGGIENLFPTSIDAKQKQLDELEKYFENFKKISADSQKSSSDSLNKIKLEIANNEKNLQSSPESQTELLNKKINILNDRKQTILRTQELWKETENIIEKNIKHLNDLIEILKKDPTIRVEEPERTYYTWQDFNQAQEKIIEYSEKMESEKSKKENLRKQKSDEKSNLLYIQKQILTKNSERKSLSEKPLDIIETENLALLDSIISQEINLLNEKTNYSNLKMEYLEQEIKLKESEYELQQFKFNALNNIIGKRITITSKELEEAKQDLENTSQKVAKDKEELHTKRDAIKKRKEKQEIEIESIKEEIKQAKDENNEISIYLLESKRQKQEGLLYVLEKELKLIDTQLDSDGTQILTKEIQRDIRNLYYEIETKQQDPEEKTIELQNKKDQISKEIKRFTTNKKDEEIALAEANRKIESIKLKQEDIKKKKDTIFKNSSKQYNETLSNLSNAENQYVLQGQLIQKTLLTYSDIISKREKILSKLIFIIGDLEERQILNIWKRSPKAISFIELQRSIFDAEAFFKKLFWDTPLYLGPASIYKTIKNFDVYNYINFAILIAFFFALFFIVKKLLFILKNLIQQKLPLSKENKHKTYFLLTIDSLTNFAASNLKLLFTWTFIYFHIFFDFRYLFSFLKPIANSYSIALFYLISIPILIYLSSQLILNLKILNQKLSFLFFTEKSQSKFLFLLTSILYATSILIPLRRAFLWYSDYPSEFPNVILAAYSLILIIVILLFFGKEDILTLIPSKLKFFAWLKTKIDKYYYPVFIFFMGLLVLSNPYIGYSNLAWYLFFAVPSTVFLIYGMFFVHHYIRKYSVSFFLQEDEEEIVDKFDYAKTYYGFFIVVTFLALLFSNFLLISRIWRFNYTAESLWTALSENWVVTIGADIKIGIIQFLTMIMFIAFGFLISSLSHKFLLNKLFDIFRTEPGTQNTFFRISHYIILSVTILLGLGSIHLEQFIFWVGGFLFLGLGISLKDIVTDFVAGFLVLIERTIEIGNFVQLDDHTRGTVHKISARATTIRTAKNFSIIVPNKDLISKPIINWGQGRLAVGFEVTFLVSYKSDPAEVKKIMLEIIGKHSAILKVPSIVIRLEDFSEDGLKFFARAFISSRKVRDQWDIASDLRFALLKEFAENDIVIPFPQRTVHFSQQDNKPVKGIDIKFDNH